MSVWYKFGTIAGRIRAGLLRYQCLHCAPVQRRKLSRFAKSQIYL